METNARCLVRFRDKLEKNPEIHFGILFENDFILCFCCKGYLEPGDYEIVEKYNGFEYLDDTLKEYY